MLRINDDQHTSTIASVGYLPLLQGAAEQPTTTTYKSLLRSLQDVITS